jgi:hypothetical protein
VAQDEDLDVLGALRSGQENEPARDTDQHEVGRPERHVWPITPFAGECGCLLKAQVSTCDTVLGAHRIPASGATMPYAPATRIFSVNADPTCAHVVRGGGAMTLPGLPDEARRPVLSPLTGRPFELRLPAELSIRRPDRSFLWCADQLSRFAGSLTCPSGARVVLLASGVQVTTAPFGCCGSPVCRLTG